MQRYRWNQTEKPVEVEAVQLTHDNVKDVVAWCDGLEVVEQDPTNPSITFAGINVLTQSGMVRLSEGQYLIRGTSGHFFVAGPNTFEHNFKLS